MTPESSLPLWSENAPGFNPEFDQSPPALIPYLLDTDQPRGAVIVCPGGGYHVHAAHEAEPIARWLNSEGFNAFVLEYRLNPYNHPVPMHDVQRAVRLVRYHADEWLVDPAHIGVLGFSAGGHLAGTTCTHFDSGDKKAADPVDRVSCRPDAVVLCYAVLSFKEFGHGGSAQNLLGENPEEALLLELSHELNVKDDTPPVFLWHTSDDAVVPVENSLLMASALRAKKIPFELHVYPTGNHGLGLSIDNPPVSGWSALCGAWLKNLGF